MSKLNININLDVIVGEVKNKQFSSKLIKFHKNNQIKITPHIASLTYAKESIRQALENFRRVKQGNKLLNEVNRQNMY